MKASILTSIIFLANIVCPLQADIYSELANSALSTAELLGSNSMESRERYIIQNGVPITTRIYRTKYTHKKAIDEALKLKVKNKSELNNESLPLLIANDEWSAIYSINVNEVLSYQSIGKNTFNEKNNLNSNYIILARSNGPNKGSTVFEYRYKTVEDMLRHFISEDKETECDEVLNLQRYTSSRRTYCMTEITSENIKSQVVIFEGIGNPDVRANHYKQELIKAGYNIDVTDSSSPNRTILFASNEISRVTIFSTMQDGKVMDVIQSNF